MSDEMPPSWKYLSSASSRISFLNGYTRKRETGSPGWRERLALHSQERECDRQSWKAWAGQKIKAKRKMFGATQEANEVVNIFPGWAARRYATDGNPSQGRSQVAKPFELDVFVSGYAITRRSPENASRSQRAFIRLAKAFASLPKLASTAEDIQPNTSSFAQLTPSTEELLAKVDLPPRPSEVTEDCDVEVLEEYLRRAKQREGPQSDDIEESLPSLSFSSSSRSSNHGFKGVSSNTNPTVPLPQNPETSVTTDVIRRLHANLEKRLQPFWSSALPNRIIRLYLFTSPNHIESFSDSDTKNTEDELFTDVECGPLASMDINTASDGSFQAKFKIKWEDLCQHPGALHIAFGDPIEEHQVLIIARLLPPQPKSSASLPSTPLSTIPLTTGSKQLSSVMRIPITYSQIRVISDIDDTVKFSGILSGARAVFHNVFVKDLRDIVIPGMGEWYSSMWSRGSNGPFELLPVLNEFLHVSQLPPGSIRLRSYAGRSLFNGLLSAPATRKRAGVTDVLDNFPDSRFFLIGDSGEQDLELYADLARERPNQIIGVFVRDARESDPNNFAPPKPLDDPTGWNAIGDAGTRPVDRPLISRSETDASAASSLLFSNYDYSSTIRAPHDIEKTPHPNVFDLDDSIVVNNRSRNDVPYFSTSSMSLSVEPQSITNRHPSGDFATPTARYSARMASSSSPGPAGPNGYRSHSEPSPQASDSGRKPIFSKRFINKPPERKAPPSIPASNPEEDASLSQMSSASSSMIGVPSPKKKFLSESEKRRNKLQLRVYRARTQMPGQVPLRVFGDPSECVEVQEILDREAAS